MALWDHLLDLFEVESYLSDEQCKYPSVKPDMEKLQCTKDNLCGSE